MSIYHNEKNHFNYKFESYNIFTNFLKLINKFNISIDSPNHYRYQSLISFLLEKKFSYDIIHASLLYFLVQSVDNDFDKSKIKYIINNNFNSQVLFFLCQFIKFNSIVKSNIFFNKQKINKICIFFKQKIYILLSEIVFFIKNLENISEIDFAYEKNSFVKLSFFYIFIGNIIKEFTLVEKIENKLLNIINPLSKVLIDKFLTNNRKKHLFLLTSIIENLYFITKENKINADFTYRVKSNLSIWCKMVRKKTGIDKIKDILGIRIITFTEKNCYFLLNTIVNEYKKLLCYFKDFIKKPKQNGYSAIHILIKKGQHYIEIQIRTKKMDEFCQNGKAAHWIYKKDKIKLEKL